MPVFVKEASVIRTGVARIALDFHGTRTADTKRLIAAACYRVAAKLEDIAAAEGFAYQVDASKVRIGVVSLHYVLGGMDGDGMSDEVAGELAIDACGENGLYPIDALVEMGEVDPTADDSDCGDGPAGHQKAGA